MTKEMYLKLLLENKKSWQVMQPVFEEQCVSIKLDSDRIYEGVLKINVDEGTFFECYVESLKDIVRLKSPWVTGINPQIEYQIDPTYLKETYPYEEEITLMYQGGYTSVRFLIEKNTANKVIQEKTYPDIIPEMTPYTIRTKEKSAPQIHNLLFEGLKKTYHPKETIRLKIKSSVSAVTTVSLHMNSELVVPHRLELFVNDEWTQEWYVKQNGFEKLLSRWTGKAENETEVVLSVFADNWKNPIETYTLIITPFEPYITRFTVKSKKDYRIQKSDCILRMRSRCFEINEDELLKEKFRACLNYDQNDLQLRLLYILFLMKNESKKAAREEFQLLRKLISKMILSQFEEAVDGVSILLNGSKEELRSYVDGDVNSKHWIIPILKIEALKSLRHDFTGFDRLYQKGIRSSFLFAEAVFYLNTMPVLPKESQTFYLTCLHWAINHDVLSKEWIAKIEKYYYVFEKETAVTFRLSLELYKRVQSLNLLRLVCANAMKEQIYTPQIIELYEEAFENGVYITKLENSYMQASYQLKRAPNLKWITYTTNYEAPVLEFLFTTIIKSRLDFPAHYKRAYRDIVKYISELQVNSSEALHIIRLLFHEFLEEHRNVIIDLFKRDDLDSLYNDFYGKEIMNAALHLCFTVNRYFTSEDSKFIITRLFDRFGFEGISKVYGEDEIIYRYALMEETFEHDQLIFLPIDLYRQKIDPPSLVSLFLSKLLYNDFPDEIITLYERLHYEHEIIETIYENDHNGPEFNGFDKVSGVTQEDMDKLFFHYLGKKILTENYSIDKNLLQHMYEYTHTYEPENTGFIYALAKSAQDQEIIDDKMGEKIYALAKKHDIILPWKKLSGLSKYWHVIEFLGEQTDKVFINFRYPNEEGFSTRSMEHIGFGMFIHPILLFYGESFEYFIVHHTQSRSDIPISELLTLSDNRNQAPPGGQRIGDDEQRDSKDLVELIDQIAQSFELDDYVSGRILEEEFRDYKNSIKKIPRL